MIEKILKHNSVITIIGSGGKTTTMYYLAEKFYGNVLITTTTKIFYTDRYPVITSDKIKDFLSNNNRIIVAGGRITEENKITPLNIDLLKELKKYFQLIIIEGDGSKGKSLKAYREYEPVIPNFTDILITVLGFDVFNEPFSEKIVHRFDLMKKIVNFPENTKITVPELLEIIKKCYFKAIPNWTENFLLINKVKKHYLKDAEKLRELLLKKGKFKEIFIQTYSE